jgi:hypothetical protein
MHFFIFSRILPLHDDRRCVVFRCGLYCCHESQDNSGPHEGFNDGGVVYVRTDGPDAPKGFITHTPPRRLDQLSSAGTKKTQACLAWLVACCSRAPSQQRPAESSTPASGTVQPGTSAPSTDEVILFRSIVPPVNPLRVSLLGASLPTSASAPPLLASLPAAEPEAAAPSEVGPSPEQRGRGQTHP